MSDPPTFAIVGAGLAGAKAAEALRAEGFDGNVVLLGAEPHRPYERPPLSKDYLQGSADRDTVFVHPPEWYADHRIDLRVGTTVTAVDRHARSSSPPTGTGWLRQAAAGHRLDPAPTTGARSRPRRRALPAQPRRQRPHQGRAPARAPGS